MTRRDLHELLEVAMVEWATEQRDTHGDSFATATELESIKGDPLGFSDLLPRDAKEFLGRLIRIQHDRDDKVAMAELAVFHRAQIFQTSDGYRLRFNGSVWTDGDLEFRDQDAGYPVDAGGDVLEGRFII